MNEYIQNEEEQLKREQEILARREERHRRRQKDQILVYMEAFAFVILTAVGFGLLISFFSDNESIEIEESQQIIVESILATEETIEAPEETEEPEEPEEPVIELTDEEILSQIVEEAIEVMPLEDKVAGLFVVEPEAITGVATAIQAGTDTQTALASYPVGGLIYFNKNMRSKPQLEVMLENTKLYTKYPVFLAVDEEGGEASRLAKAGLATQVSSPEMIGKTGEIEYAYMAGSTVGKYLSDYGFNLNFAPVADLNCVEDSVIGSRSFGSDAEEVSQYVLEMMRGIQEQNVTACLKHFPGIGSTILDTHFGMATTERTREEFEKNDFKVFKKGIEEGAEMIMVGHISAPGLTGDNMPCSMSETVVTDILRKELNFKGVIISDAMDMAAITEYYEADQAAIMALRAGCDMILMPEDFKKAYEGVLMAVQSGTISEERIDDSLRRVYRIKYVEEAQKQQKKLHAD